MLKKLVFALMTAGLLAGCSRSNDKSSGMGGSSDSSNSTSGRARSEGGGGLKGSGSQISGSASAEGGSSDVSTNRNSQSSTNK
jgi:hypothetical protein